MQTEAQVVKGGPAPFGVGQRGETASEAERVKVLLIEDNPDDARLIQMMLARAGDDLFEIEHVKRLSEALKRLEQGGIGVVLSDLSLPDSHGLGTFGQLHARASHVPIIVLSG